jgi:hypothetical protein
VLPAFTSLKQLKFIIFQVLEPPAEYLEEDITSKDDQRVPPDALYMLQSIRYYNTKYFIISSLVGWGIGVDLVRGKRIDVLFCVYFK